MDTAAAIRQLRADQANADLIRDAYLDADPVAAAERFEHSGEFFEVLTLLEGSVRGADILDVGAGNGIASAAFAKSGADVVALDPDPGEDVGLAALRVATAGLPVRAMLAVGEAIPLEDSCVDVVFARQVLHHARDLERLVGECARVLRPGGVLLACREHVVDDEAQLEEFLAGHPVHQLAGGEHAYPRANYVAALIGAGLRVERVIQPLDSLINAFPEVRTESELRALPRERMRATRGVLGASIAAVAPGWTRARLNGRGAGRMYSFVARKP